MKRLASRRSNGIEARSEKRSPITRSAEPAAATNSAIAAGGCWPSASITITACSLGRAGALGLPHERRADRGRRGVELPRDGGGGAVVDEDDRADLGPDALEQLVGGDVLVGGHHGHDVVGLEPWP